MTDMVSTGPNGAGSAASAGGSLPEETMRELREQMYQAYMNRASEGELDNRPIIERLLALRKERAALQRY